jgi:hypothetical protein
MLSCCWVCRESYRLLAEDLSVQLLSSSHTGPIAALAFPPTRADVFATGGAGPSPHSFFFCLQRLLMQFVEPCSLAHAGV